MTGLTALLVYAGIPIALALILWILLSVKSWSRGPEGDVRESETGPFLAVTGPALPDPSRLPRDLDSYETNLAGGGARGRW